ncbi:MAG: type II toxin-antitoxin system MqsA family antitoxin [Neisseriaceae bacterium]|nr:type II toxin-antitoxin system MqsA family antitoxin [Neisseriaceae bacterium]
MKCPVCGFGELSNKIKDIEYSYKGRTTIIPDVCSDCCPACDEMIMAENESRRVMSAMTAFQKQVNSELTDTHYISAVRNKLRLTQAEAAALFGGGVNAFSRYETGKAKPPVALVKLFKILDKHPELIAEI